MVGRRSTRIRRTAKAIDRWDLAVGARIARTSFPAPIDRGLPLLTRAADRSVLWAGVSVALAATGKSRLRRAAARGLGSIAVASLLANQVAKRTVRRRRPLLEHIPIARIAHRVPISNSFPSGHSASAAAFAVGVAVEAPELAVPIGALAGAVAFSRIFTGVHFASDVFVGAAIGATVAGVGAAVVPAHHSQPARPADEPKRPQPPRPTGRGLVAVINCRSHDGGPSLVEQLREALPHAEFVELPAESGSDELDEALRAAAKRAEVLGAAGGDGTINAAAAAAMAADLPLLVIPAGTFDHFAKDLDLDEVADAIEAVRTGRAVRVDVGEADGRPFLNTASLGSYPEFVRIRQRLEQRLGKPVAAAVAMVVVLRRCPPLVAEIDGVSRRLLLVFIGNGDYRPRGFVPRWRRRLSTGRLDVRLVDSSRPGSPWRLVAGALTGDLYRSSRYIEALRDRVSVKLTGETGFLARDGEIEQAPSEVSFGIRRQALTVYRGDPRADSAGGARPRR